MQKSDKLRGKSKDYIWEGLKLLSTIGSFILDVTKVDPCNQWLCKVRNASISGLQIFIFEKV